MLDLAHVHCTRVADRQVRVEATQPSGGDAPRVAAGPGRGAAPRSVASRGSASSRSTSAAYSLGTAAVDEEPGARRGRRGCAGRPRSPRRPGCRTPPPRGPPGRTIRCGTGPGTRRRPGTSRRAGRGGTGGTQRTRPATPRLLGEGVEPRDLGRTVGAARPADDDELGVDGRAATARQRDGDVDALQRLDAPHEEQHRPVGGAARAGVRAPARSLGENSVWSTPGGMISTRSASASRLGAQLRPPRRRWTTTTTSAQRSTSASTTGPGRSGRR